MMTEYENSNHMRLDLVIKGPGFGDCGVELTSNRMWAGAAFATAVLAWTFILKDTNELELRHIIVVDPRR